MRNPKISKQTYKTILKKQVVTTNFKQLYKIQFQQHLYSTLNLYPKAVSPVKTRRNHWAGDTSLVGAGVGSNPTRNQIFLITFDLALDLGELDSSSIH